MREAKGKAEVKPLDLMINHHTNALFFDNVEVPVENLIGEEGMGFRYIIDGWNAERILVAAEAIGDGRWFVERAAKYASERNVFGKPIGANQGVQFPIAKAYANIEAADLVRFQADKIRPRGKMRRRSQPGQASRIGSGLGSGQRLPHDSWRLRLCRRVRRRTKVPRDPALTVAPVSNNLVLAYLGQHVLGMPKS